MRIRLAIRGFAGRDLKFEDPVDVDEAILDSVIHMLATKHAEALKSHELHMIEIEFLDEPDPLQRFFRFGTDPSGMVLPLPALPEMSDDVIRASLSAGVIAVEIDDYLKRDHFVPRARKIGCDISWSFVEEMVAEARAMGVPEQYCTLSAVIQAKLNDPAFIAQAREMQRRSDRAWLSRQQGAKNA